MGKSHPPIFPSIFINSESELKADLNVVVVICEYDAPWIAHVHLDYVQVPERRTMEAVGVLLFVGAYLLFRLRVPDMESAGRVSIPETQ